VLYFDNLSPATADAYLADGLAEAVITRLGRIERLRVKSQNAVRHYRGRPLTDAAALGRALEVAHLVSGSVRRVGERLQVTVELLRTSDAVHLWGEQYTRADTDLLELEESIASAIASAIAGRLLPPERAALARRATRSREAYDLFLRGNYELAQRTAAAVARAIERYEAATRLDPSFTDAQARTALGYALYLDWRWPYAGLPAESLLVRGLAVADRALRQDSSSSDAWMGRGYLRMFRYPRTFDGVRQAFERSVALDPRNAEAYHQYAGFLRVVGDDSAAVEASVRTLAIEPDRPVTLFQLAQVYIVNRQFHQAQLLLDSCLALNPGFHYAYEHRARARLGLRDLAGARADAEALSGLGGDFERMAEMVRALVAAASGDTAAARAHALAALGRPAHDHPEPVFLAGAFAAAGEQERALEMLERVRPRGGELWFALRWPDVDPLRAQPRFHRLVEESRPPVAPR
jgi:TolB-like protein/Tfp pilus assembly protein PilF